MKINCYCFCYRCNRRFPGSPPCPVCQESVFIQLLRRKPSPPVKSEVKYKPLNINARGQMVTVKRRAKIYGRKVKKDDINDTCSICMAQYKDGEEVYETSCLHKFHCLCVERWFDVEKTCPECRTAIQIQEKSSLESSINKTSL